MYLFANKIDQSGAPFIADIIKNKLQLQTLGLSNNKLYKYGAMEIAKTGLTGKQSLVKLSIENNCIGNEGLKAISIALSECRALQEIYLYNNEIDDEPIEDFTNLIAQ